jgi:hypothetical protein
LGSKLANPARIDLIAGRYHLLEALWGFAPRRRPPNALSFAVFDFCSSFFDSDTISASLAPVRSFISRPSPVSAITFPPLSL